MRADSALRLETEYEKSPCVDDELSPAAGSLNLSVAETAGEFRGMPYKAFDLGFTVLPGDV